MSLGPLGHTCPQVETLPSCEEGPPTWFRHEEGKAQRGLAACPAAPAPRSPGLLRRVPRPLTSSAPQVLSTRILAMKASLCKLSPCAVTRVCEYHAKLFLIAASSTLKSLLRPHVLNTPDKSPGDRLTEVCAKITDVGGSCPILRAALAAQDPLAVAHVWGVGDTVGVNRNKDDPAWGWRPQGHCLCGGLEAGGSCRVPGTGGPRGGQRDLKASGGHPEPLPPTLPSRFPGSGRPVPHLLVHDVGVGLWGRAQLTVRANGRTCEVLAAPDCLSPPRH